MVHARPVNLYGESVMTRLGFDGFGVETGAEHSNDGLGMRWDFLITRRGLGLGLGDGDGDGDGGMDTSPTGRHPGKFTSR